MQESISVSSPSFSVPAALKDGDHSTDLVFLVEDQRLHFSKMLLTLSSPVFQALLTPDFVQKHSEGIPLEGKKYNAVAFFFMQLHPVFCAVTQITDDMLLDTLALAEEYKVDHLNTKCEAHMETRLDVCEAKNVLTVDTILHYLTACEKYHLTKHRDRLVKLAAGELTNSLQSSRFFAPVPVTALNEVLLFRSQTLENELSSLKGKMRSNLPTVLSDIDRVQISWNTLRAVQELEYLMKSL